MAFKSLFLNFNINHAGFNFNFGFSRFSMPNFFCTPFPSGFNVFNNFNAFNTFSFFKPYGNFMNSGYLSPWNCFSSPPPMQTLDFNSVFNSTPLSWSSDVWQSNSVVQTPSFDTFNRSSKIANGEKINVEKTNVEKNKTKNSEEEKNYNEKKAKKKNKITTLRTNFVNKAQSYVGKVNSDAEGNRLFSPNGVSQAWCADFVTYVAKDTLGSTLPSSFGSSSVSGLRSWAEQNDCYLAMPSSKKGEFISKNVKVGDIMIEKNAGKSHTGVVVEVNNDGSFKTVEGNCSNKVTTRTYNSDSATLSGFISLDKYV